MLEGSNGVGGMGVQLAECEWSGTRLQDARHDDVRSAMKAAQAETQAARARSRRFLADAAHQIRTPVAGIQACAETLLRQPRPTRADQEHLLTQIAQETARVGRLVRDLLEAARADQDMDLERTPCDVVAICQSEVERLRCREQALVMTAVAPGWSGHPPRLDAQAVRDIVAILLDNARRHASSRITVTVTEGDGVAEVRVTDDGPGLSAKVAERAFECFASLDGSVGSGFGLPIARELARAHGGDVEYHDGDFVVSLPFVVDASSP